MTALEILRCERRIRELERALDFASQERLLLREAILKHRNARGHERCWQNDLELYAVLGDALPASPGLPAQEDFIAGCYEYYEQQTRKSCDD